MPRGARVDVFFGGKLLRLQLIDGTRGRQADLTSRAEHDVGLGAVVKSQDPPVGESYGASNPLGPMGQKASGRGSMILDPRRLHSQPGRRRASHQQREPHMFTIPFLHRRSLKRRTGSSPEPTALERGWCLWMRSREAGDHRPSGRRDAMAGRHSRKHRRLCQMRNDHVIPAFVLPPRRPWMAQGTGHRALGSGHRAAVAALLPCWSSPSASSDTMCQGAALMAWWDWGLAGEGLKIGRSQGCGCRRRAAGGGRNSGEQGPGTKAPGLPGQGISPGAGLLTWAPHPD